MKPEKIIVASNFSTQLKKINIESIRYFVILAEIGNFSDAARELKISQQALSKSISNIEEELGLKLIERDRTFKRITVAGQFFLEKAKAIMENLYEVNNYFESFKSNEIKGWLSIGWSGVWGISLLPEFLKGFLNKYPDVYPKMYFMSNDNIEKFVSIGELDIGLINNRPSREGLLFMKGPDFPYVIAVVSGQEHRKWDELSYIVPKRWKAINLNSDNWSNEYKRNIVAEVDSLQAGINMCLAGLGAIYVPEITIREHIIEGTMALIAEVPFKYSANHNIIWNKNTPLRPSQSAFINELKVELNL